jgi:DNA (cytosine-5)-methyltransferase 1
MDLSKQTLPQLISLCKERKIKGYSGKRKDQLIALLTPQNEIVQPEPEQEPEKAIELVQVKPERRAMSLFSGAGGDTLGLEHANYKVVAFSEFKAPAIKTHQLVFPDSVHLVDPTSKSPNIQNIPDKVFEPYKGTIDVLVAGCPCQGFSHAGKKDSTDPRNELVNEVIRVANIVQPTWIVFENVKGLMARYGTDPNTKHPRLVIDIIKDLFKRNGYNTTNKIIQVTDAGVPQKRQRLILIAHRSTDDAGKPYPHIPWHRITSYPSIPTIRHILQPHLYNATEFAKVPADLDPRFWIITTATEPSGTPHPNLVRLVKGLRNASTKEIDANPQINDLITEPNGLISFGKRSGGYHGEVLDPDQPSKTIICTYNLCPRLFVGLRNPTINKYWLRTLTPSELGQIQGFPADYPWQGTEKEAIIQIGNAIPPPLMERIVNALPFATFKEEEQVPGKEELEDEEEE